MAVSTRKTKMESKSKAYKKNTTTAILFKRLHCFYNIKIMYTFKVCALYVHFPRFGLSVA